MKYMLKVLEERLALCKLPPEEAIPRWAEGELWSVTRTDEELSVVCAEARVPVGVAFEGGWRTIKLNGIFEFSLVGILAELSAALAAAEVSIFALSTFNTDYILVREAELERAKEALKGIGCVFLAI